MTTKRIENPRKQYHYWTGALVAIALLLGSGLGYRVAAKRLAAISGTVVLPRGTLAQLSLHIGDWVGEDVELDERIVQATDTDDHLERIYTRVGGNEAVSLFIAYGVHFRDLMPHRPEVCYPGAGWTHEDTRLAEVQTAEGASLPVQIHRFRRGGLAPSRVIVLNYYDVGGRYCPDVSLLRSKAWRHTGQARYVAQVQISRGAGGLQHGAEESARAFAAVAAPAIRTFLADAVARATAAADTHHHPLGLVGN